MLKRILPMAALALLSGCMMYKSGTKIDGSKLSQLKPGVTTIAQAEKLLGKPNMVNRNSDGSATLMYSYISDSADGKSFIPVVGAFMGKSTGEQQYTSINFDKNGRYKNWTESGGKSSSSMGAAAFY